MSPARPDRPNPGHHPGPFLLALALALGAAAAPADEAAAQQAWEARASYERQLVDSDLPQWSDWETWQAESRRFFDGGNVAVELRHSRRFGIGDAAAALDGYIDLAERVYLHARAEVAPDARVVARQDHRAELFAATPGGWEGSAGYRFMRFPLVDVHVLGVSLARYLPGWYLRLRGDLNPSFDEAALFVGATVRRFLPTLDGHAELSAGTGKEVVEVAEGPSVDIRDSRFVALGGEAFPWPSVGLSGRFSYWSLEAIPTRLGLGAGVILRW